MEAIGPKRRKTEAREPKLTVLEPTKIERSDSQSLPGSSKLPTRVLKSCTRCRQHKTRCAAAARKPLPCSHCARRNAEAVPEVVEAVKARSGDVVELLMLEGIEL